MYDVKRIYALVKIGQTVTWLVQQMSAPSKDCETPEPSMETVYCAAKYSQTIVEDSVENPPTIDVWYCIIVLFNSNPDEQNCPNTGYTGNHGSTTFNEVVIFLFGNYASVTKEEESEEPKPLVADSHEPWKPWFEHNFTQSEHRW